jgi:GNAT superfamily N-acetyltransferase
MPPGSDIVDDYIPHMLDRCKRCEGKILIAEIDGEVAGFATILTKVRSEEPEDGDLEYGLVSELMVVEKFRKKGLVRRLLEEAESYARANDVKWLRIGVLAGNRAADKLYASMGFSSQYVEREKDLTKSR